MRIPQEEEEEEGGEDEAQAADCDIVATGTEVMERSVLQPPVTDRGCSAVSVWCSAIKPRCPSQEQWAEPGSGRRGSYVRYQPRTHPGKSRARGWSAAAQPSPQQDVLSSQQSSRAVRRQPLSLLLLHPCIWERHMDGCRAPPAVPSAPGGNR